MSFDYETTVDASVLDACLDDGSNQAQDAAAAPA